jgi:hypothetical protein
VDGTLCTLSELRSLFSCDGDNDLQDADDERGDKSRVMMISVSLDHVEPEPFRENWVTRNFSIRSCLGNVFLKSWSVVIEEAAGLQRITLPVGYARSVAVWSITVTGIEWPVRMAYRLRIEQNH